MAGFFLNKKQLHNLNIHKNWANIQPIQDDVHLTLSQQNFALSLLMK
jgi:hypothetical protein